MAEKQTARGGEWKGGGEENPKPCWKDPRLLRH